MQRNTTKTTQRSRVGVKHKGTLRGWERKMERSGYQREWEGRKRRAGPRSQRDERGLVSVSCPCGAQINRPKKTSELLRKFFCFPF